MLTVLHIMSSVFIFLHSFVTGSQPGFTSPGRCVVAPSVLRGDLLYPTNSPPDLNFCCSHFEPLARYLLLWPHTASTTNVYLLLVRIVKQTPSEYLVILVSSIISLTKPHKPRLLCLVASGRPWRLSSRTVMTVV